MPVESTSTIDFTKPIETIEGEPARVLTEGLAHATFPIAVAYRSDQEDGKESLIAINADGDSESMIGFIRNVVEEKAEGEGPANPVDTVELHPNNQIRVSHRKHGTGTVTKMRKHSKSPFGVVFDNRKISGETDVFWALGKNISIISHTGRH